MTEVSPFQVVSLMFKNRGRMVNGFVSSRGTDYCVPLPSTHRSRETIAFSSAEDVLIQDKKIGLNTMQSLGNVSWLDLDESGSGGSLFFK